MKQLVNKVLDKDMISPGDVVDFSFSNSRLNEVENGALEIKNSQDSDIAPTITTGVSNYGICVERTLAQDIADKLIELDCVEEGDFVRTSYANSRLDELNHVDGGGGRLK